METDEIYGALKSNQITIKGFHNIYPIDKLPNKKTVRYNKRGESFLVVNLDPSYKSGSHWVALCISPSLNMADEYFDSYGREPPKQICKYLEGNRLYINKQLQSYTSTICGQWCIYYIWRRLQGFSLNEIVKEFEGSTPEENDKKVNACINKKFVSKPQPLVDFDFIQTALSFNDSHA